MIGLVLTVILMQAQMQVQAPPGTVPYTLQLPTLPPSPNAKTLNMVCDRKQGTYDCRWLEEAMVAPKVEHKQKQHTETYDEVTRTCPDGYEGHFVDLRPGFDWTYWSAAYGGNGWSGGFIENEPGYTVCFKKEFMDKIRSNPDLVAPRPTPPKGV